VFFGGRISVFGDIEGLMMQRVIITGATGFVGAALIARMTRESRFTIRAAVRREAPELPSEIEQIVTGDLTPNSNWQKAVAYTDTVVHLAARVHIMRDAVKDPLAEYRQVNVAGTLNLARQAAAAGVRRFVFLSSVKVNGEQGMFTESDLPAPQDAYGISKYEAEEGLRQISAEKGMETVIIRAPLVYGPGVRANFEMLMGAVARGIPLPLGGIDNRRSLVALDNLVDFILACIERPYAANETFFVSDGEDLSTSELILRLANCLDRPARLFSVPAPVLVFGGSLLGRRNMVQRLLGSLQVDISKARAMLRWTPPLSVDEGLRRAVASL